MPQQQLIERGELRGNVQLRISTIDNPVIPIMLKLAGCHQCTQAQEIGLMILYLTSTKPESQHVVHVVREGGEEVKINLYDPYSRYSRQF